LCVSAQAIGVYLGALKAPEASAASESSESPAVDEPLDEDDPDVQAFLQKLGGALDQ
jgi:hypothetical protein